MEHPFPFPPLIPESDVYYTHPTTTTGHRRHHTDVEGGDQEDTEQMASKRRLDTPLEIEVESKQDATNSSIVMIDTEKWYEQLGEHHGQCDICMRWDQPGLLHLHVPLTDKDCDNEYSSTKSNQGHCAKLICVGCFLQLQPSLVGDHANLKRVICPFCRQQPEIACVSRCRSAARKEAFRIYHTMILTSTGFDPKSRVVLFNPSLFDNERHDIDWIRKNPNLKVTEHLYQPKEPHLGYYRIERLLSVARYKHVVRTWGTFDRVMPFYEGLDMDMRVQLKLMYYYLIAYDSPMGPTLANVNPYPLPQRTAILYPRASVFLRTPDPELPRLEEVEHIRFFGDRPSAPIVHRDNDGMDADDEDEDDDDDDDDDREERKQESEAQEEDDDDEEDRFSVVLEIIQDIEDGHLTNPIVDNEDIDDEPYREEEQKEERKSQPPEEQGPNQQQQEDGDDDEEEEEDAEEYTVVPRDFAMRLYNSLTNEQQSSITSILLITIPLFQRAIRNLPLMATIYPGNATDQMMAAMGVSSYPEIVQTFVYYVTELERTTRARCVLDTPNVCSMEWKSSWEFVLSRLRHSYLLSYHLHPNYRLLCLLLLLQCGPKTVRDYYSKLFNVQNVTDLSHSVRNYSGMNLLISFMKAPVYFFVECIKFLIMQGHHTSSTALAFRYRSSFMLLYGGIRYEVRLRNSPILNKCLEFLPGSYVHFFYDLSYENDSNVLKEYMDDIDQSDTGLFVREVRQRDIRFPSAYRLSNFMKMYLYHLSQLHHRSDSLHPLHIYHHERIRRAYKKLFWAPDACELGLSTLYSCYMSYASEEQKDYLRYIGNGFHIFMLEFTELQYITILWYIHLLTLTPEEIFSCQYLIDEAIRVHEYIRNPRNFEAAHFPFFVATFFTPSKFALIHTLDSADIVNSRRLI